jgi:uncharacterized protein (TIGR02147 family)
MATDMIKIFDYSDHRHYLKDTYDYLKKTQERFSLQVLSDETGLSRAFLHRIFTGQQPIPLDIARMISDFLRHKKRESEYFLEMIQFARSRNENQKEYHFQRMLEYRKKDKATLQKEIQFKYFSRMHYVIIRELLATCDFRGDYDALAERVYPPISAVQAKKAIEVLENLELIRQKPNGRYVCTRRVISTRTDFEQIRRFAIRKFQRESIQKSAEAIELCKPGTQEMITETMGVSEDGFLRIRDEIAAFRKSIADIISQDKDVDRVYQINLNLFPVSKISKKKVQRTTS